ncbi:MAG: hypothetical protein ACRCUS_06705 [Anaerovoracaceae bacterium]
MNVGNATINSSATATHTDWTAIDANDKTIIFATLRIAPVHTGAIVPLNYIIQVDTQATFTSPKMITSFIATLSTDTLIPITVYTMNKILVREYGITQGRRNIYIRQSVYAQTVDNVIVSDTASKQIASFSNVGPALFGNQWNTVANIKPWFVMGSFTAKGDFSNLIANIGSGLLPLAPDTMATFEANGNGTYQNIFFMPAGATFKIIATPGNTNPSFGSTGGNLTPVLNGADNLTTTTAGWYLIKLNSTTNTCTITSTTPPTSTVYATMYVRGTFNSWNTFSMSRSTADNTTNYMWFGLLRSGAFVGSQYKFNSGGNADWSGLNSGTNDGGIQTVGFLNGTQNIAAPLIAGNYIVVMDANTMFYYTFKVN